MHIAQDLHTIESMRAYVDTAYPKRNTVVSDGKHTLPNLGCIWNEKQISLWNNICSIIHREAKYSFQAEERMCRLELLALDTILCHEKEIKAFSDPLPHAVYPFAYPKKTATSKPAHNVQFTSALNHLLSAEETYQYRDIILDTAQALYIEVLKFQYPVDFRNAVKRVYEDIWVDHMYLIFLHEWHNISATFATENWYGQIKKYAHEKDLNHFKYLIQHYKAIAEKVCDMDMSRAEKELYLHDRCRHITLKFKEQSSKKSPHSYY